MEYGVVDGDQNEKPSDTPDEKNVDAKDDPDVDKKWIESTNKIKIENEQKIYEKLIANMGVFRWQGSQLSA